MTVSKLNPWNWFKRENEQEKNLPVEQSEREGAMQAASPLDQFHVEFDRMMESMFSGFGMTPLRRLFDAQASRFGSMTIKPRVDVSGTNAEYVIEVDLPGVDEKDVSIDLSGDLLVLTAETSREEKSEGKGYYRVERSRGSFRRVFNLPADADRDAIAARMDRGVLRVTLPRTTAVRGDVRRIEIQGASAE